MSLQQNLGIILQDHKILLGMKKRGFGAGWYNGLGGKVEEGETIEQALEREAKQEARIQITQYDLQGRIQFHFPDKQIKVSIYHITEYTGTPQESEEMCWEWFDTDKIPYDRMWPADRHWLPLFLKGKKFEGAVHFDADKRVKKHEFAEVKSFFEG